MKTYPFELEGGWPVQLGLIALQSDETIERDMGRLLPPGAELLVSRVPSGTHVTPESLAAMEGELAQAAGLFPVSARFAALGYSCTSGTAQIGAERVAGAVRAGTKAAAVTEPVSALLAACGALKVRRIGILSPYIESVTARLCAVLGAAGIEVAAFASFNEAEEAKVARIAPASIRAAAVDFAKGAGMDALFLSCTNLRTLDVIDEIEAATGRPVLSSNQVLAWHMARLAGLEVAEGFPGRLRAAAGQRRPPRA